MTGAARWPTTVLHVKLPTDHHLRRLLADEPHARPATPVFVPGVASCVALHEPDLDRLYESLAELARLRGVDPPSRALAHGFITLEKGRLKWERHGEFASLLATCPVGSEFRPSLPPARSEVPPSLTKPLAKSFNGDAVDEFPTALSILPEGWLESLPGSVIAATDVMLIPGSAAELVTNSRKWLSSDALAGSVVLDDVARVVTDFILQEHGRTRWLVVDSGLGRTQGARVVQRIAEIEVYRMMALLAFPLAREAFGDLRRLEQRLATVMADMTHLHSTGESNDKAEALQLDELTRLAAEVERSIAATSFRFSSSRAYWKIVQARATELRERRIGDMRTITGFLSRRMAPALESVEAAARRQEALSTRIVRASALIRTRVDVAREEQNQQLLAAIDRRGKLQLRLQETVEGLSVVAITYYLVALLAYALKPFKELLPLNPDYLAAGAIPFVAIFLRTALKRRVRAITSQEH